MTLPSCPALSRRLILGSTVNRRRRFPGVPFRLAEAAMIGVYLLNGGFTVLKAQRRQKMKTEYVQFRLTPLEKNVLERQAKRLGMSTSEYIRTAAIYSRSSPIVAFDV